MVILFCYLLWLVNCFIVETFVCNFLRISYYFDFPPRRAMYILPNDLTKVSASLTVKVGCNSFCCNHIVNWLTIWSTGTDNRMSTIEAQLQEEKSINLPLLLVEPKTATIWSTHKLTRTLIFILRTRFCVWLSLLPHQLSSRSFCITCSGARWTFFVSWPWL